MKYFTWFVRILIAAILLQSLFFKFSGAPEAVAIFSSLGVEPWGRYLLGVLELITALLLIIPKKGFLKLGSKAAFIIGLGAIISHLFVLGVVSNNDGGFLFILAIVVTLGSTFLCWRSKK